MTMPSRFAVTSSDEIIKIGKEDIFIATTWAATCCALWSRAISSGPQMKLVEDLNDVAHLI